MHILLKRKTSLHRVIWSLAFRSGGTCYIFAQIQMQRKGCLIINLLTVIQWVHKACRCLLKGKQPYTRFLPTRPHWAELVIESPCPSVFLSVCLCHRETPTSEGRVDLWSKIAFLILVWDDTIFKKRGG